MHSLKLTQKSILATTSYRALLIATAMLWTPVAGISQISYAQTTKTQSVQADKAPEDFIASASKYGAYLAARIASIDHDTATSTELFKRALSLNPDNVDLMRNLFLAEIAAGNFNESIDIANQIAAHPDRKLAEDLIQFANKILQNDRDAAVKILTDMDPQKVDNYLQSALDVEEFKVALINPIVFAGIALKDNDPDKAQDELDKLDRKDINSLHELIKRDRPFITQFALSIEAIKARSYDSAITRLKASMDHAHLDKLMAGILTAWAQVGLKDTDGAIKTLSALKGPRWFQPFITLHKGYIFAANGKNSEAILEFKQAVDNVNGAEIASQAYSSAVMALSRAYAREESWEDALVTVETGLGRYSSFTPMVALRKEILDKKKQALFIKTPQQGAAAILLNIATAIDRDDNVDIAQIYMQMAKALTPKNADVNMELAQHFDREGVIEQANEHYRSITKDSPFYRISQLEIALNHDQLKQLDKAEAAFKALIKEDPKDLIAYMAYGGTMARHDKFEEAAKIYDEAVRQTKRPEPYHWNLYYRRGIAYERLGKWQEAEKNFKTALKLYPDHPDVLNYLGYTWIDMGIHLDEGLKMIQKAVDQKPNSGYIIDSLGWAYYKLGIYGKAAFYLERALEAEPADPTINDHLGDAYWHIDRKTEAGFQWNRALVLKPDEKLKKQLEIKLKDGLEAFEKKQKDAPDTAPKANGDNENKL